MGTIDSAFLEQLQGLVLEPNRLAHILRDDDARYNALFRDATVGRMRSTRFTLRVDDQVPYDGETYKLIELLQTPTGPAKATI